MISLDLETEPIDRALLAPPPVCATWHRGEAPEFALYEDALPVIEGALRSDELIIGTNLAFDMAVIGEASPGLLPTIFDKYRRNQIECIDINQKILDIASRGGTDDSYSLGRLSVRYGQPVLEKSSPWRKEFSSLRNVPTQFWPESAVSYLFGDVRNPWAIWHEQHAYARAWQDKCGHPLLHLAGAEAYKQFVLYLISAWGIKADRGRVLLLKEALDAHLQAGADLLRREGLVREDGSKDTKAAKERMVAALGGRVQRTGTGDISLNKDACDASLDPVLQAYSDYTQAVSLRGRVEDMMQGVDLPLQPRFNSLLETSRTSASKPDLPVIGVQVQNFPRMVSFSRDDAGKREPFEIGAREVLTPRDAHGFVIADYSIAELHSLAQVCMDLFGYSTMAKLLNEGKDLHSWFGGVIAGMPYAEVEARRTVEKAIQEIRDGAKGCNFGFPGGLGPDTFMGFCWKTFRLRLTREQAVRYKLIWLGAFEEMALYFKYIDGLMRGKSQALFRHLRSGRWRGRTPFCAACNSQFQELTATAAASALCEVSRQCYTDRASALFDSRIVMFTHDEIVLETPLDRAHEAAITLGKVMEERFNEWHPDCPTKAEPLVTMIYSKKAKATHDGNGRYVPWRIGT